MRTSIRPSIGAALSAAVLAVALLAGACSSEDDADGSSSATTTAPEESSEEALANPADCPNYSGTQGLSDTTIRLGSSLPLSGPFAPLGRGSKGLQAYFDMVNADGGIQGRQVELTVLDDGYLPERTRANVETLLGGDGVFALVGVGGTDNNLAVQQFLQESGQCVPNLAVATGYPGFSDPATDPWIINGLPTNRLEAVGYADYLRREQPEAKVAILAQNDTFGDTLVEDFTAAIEGSDITIVAEERFDPRTESSPQGQVTTLASSGADAWIVGVTSLPCPTALQAARDAGWSPLTFVTLTCANRALMAVAGDAAEGAVSSQVTYDPADPAAAGTAAVTEFREQGPNYGLTPADLDDLSVSYGWNFAAYVVQLLEAAPTLERAEVMDTAWRQDPLTYGLVVDGIEWSTDGTTKPYGFSQLQFIRRTGAEWIAEGEPVDLTEQVDTLGG
jgi:branched-chain amino acid transport system substrate-binding protein